MHTRNLELDRLRAVAILLTVYTHVVRVLFPWAIKPHYVRSDELFNMFNNAWTGVDLFFVISGFIICRTFQPKLAPLAHKPRQIGLAVKTFFVKRFYRIYPISWSAVALALVMSAFFQRPEYFSSFTNNAEAAVAVFSYTFNFYLSNGHYPGFTLSHYWSLAIEEQFYIVFPFFLIAVTGRKARIIVVSSCLLLITFVIRPLFGVSEILLETHTRCDGLLYGVLLALLSDEPLLLSLLPAKATRAFKLLTLLAIVSLAALPGLGLGNSFVIPAACALSTLLVASASVQCSIISLGRQVDSVLDYLGSRSYCLYIFHLPMFSLTKEILRRWSDANGLVIGPELTVAYVATALSLSLVATEIAHRLIEQPLIKRGRAYKPADRGTPDAGHGLAVNEPSVLQTMP